MRRFVIDLMLFTAVPIVYSYKTIRVLIIMWGVWVNAKEKIYNTKEIE